MILEGMTIHLDTYWLSAITDAFPARTFQLEEFHPIDNEHWRGVLVTPADMATKKVIQWMQTQNDLSDILLLKCENEACTQDCNRHTNCSIAFSCKAPVFADPIKKNKVFLQMPILLQNGTVYLKIISTDEHLKRFYYDLNELDHCEVHIIKKFKQEEFKRATLTEKQERYLRIAIDLGYYKVPRTITIHELAERVGIAQSTLGEHLRKAEECIISSYTV